MIIFLCASILLEEWDEFNDDNMMDLIQRTKGLILEKERTEVYIKRALRLSKFFVNCEMRVQEFNSILLKGY